MNSSTIGKVLFFGGLAVGGWYLWGRKSSTGVTEDEAWAAGERQRLRQTPPGMPVPRAAFSRFWASLTEPERAVFMRMTAMSQSELSAFMATPPTDPVVQSFAGKFMRFTSLAGAMAAPGAGPPASPSTSGLGGLGSYVRA